ncbi:hypothetical protein B0T21DRAFT_414772 [Apiosordaria backusii]|uniref:Uncharacterized protein n=1 Tax=Apiosordaria backusii TaxID=314023 RepID=A0AA40DWB2_9PEZI|nr:hypothetical protein B0T21DRAFT_414772 [Apiosordaria backusii]
MMFTPSPHPPMHHHPPRRLDHCRATTEDTTSAAPLLEKRVWLSNIDVQEACKQQYGNGAQARVGWEEACNTWSRHPDNNNVYASCHRRAYDRQCHDRN